MFFSIAGACARRAAKFFLIMREKICKKAIVFVQRCGYHARSFARCARSANETGRTIPGFPGRDDREKRMASVVTKADLVEAAAKAGNLSKTAAGEAVNAIFDSIVHSVAKGNRVTVVGFGTFLPRKRKARSGRNPANGKEIRISAKTVPAFSAGQGFKEAVSDR